MSEDKKCDGMVCPLTGCPIKNILIATVVTFIVTMAFDWLLHTQLMMADYTATAAMWRPEAEMNAMMGVCIFYHAVLSFGVAALYCFTSKSSSCGGACAVRGMKFGFLLGLILGISHFASYIWMPIPMDMAIKWLGGSIAWGVIIGYVLSLVSSKCCCKKA